MIIFAKHRRFWFSLKKFYEIQPLQGQELLPDLPQDAVFSKHIGKIEEKNLQYKEVQSWMSKNKQLSYSELLNTNPYGSIETFTLKGINLTLISTNYHRLQQKKLHKVLFKTAPDAILIQRRPQYYLPDFQIIKKGSDGVFSDKAYLSQLNVNPKDIRPTEKSNSPLVNALNKTKNDPLQQNPQKQILKVAGFETVYGYATSYNTNLFLGEIPTRCFRQWIVNSHTLMEMQEMFKNICRRLPRYKAFKFTPYQLGTLIYPEIFLKLNDHYMSTIIQMMIATKKYKNIVGVFGIMQNLAVKNMLETQKSLNPIIELLIPPKPKGTMIRDIQNLQILQKHIIFDTLFYGQSITDVKIQHLHTTNAIMQKYCREIPSQILMKFRYQKTTEYVSLMRQKAKEGEQQIKKQFVRETLRQ